MRATFGRRAFLSGSFVAALAALNGTRGLAAARESGIVTGPYGKLSPVNDLETGLPLLRLPEGFEYRTYSWTGDPMSNGQPTPELHDGMGVIHTARAGKETIVTLVRNHERAFGDPIQAPARYDRATPDGERGPPGGGTTTLRFRGRRWVSVLPSLGGTLVNCAGGATPWGTWLSCEETLVDLSAGGGRKHGYVYEVRRNPAKTTGRPIVAMGRMIHEAVAVDPKTRIAYLTEDNPRRSTLFRFLPTDARGQPGSYEAGGKLQAARVVGRPNADLLAPALGDRHPVEWVDIVHPDADPARPPDNLPEGPPLASGPFLEAWSKGALLIARGEGVAQYGGKIYFVDTAAGTNLFGRRGSGDGAVWEYDPAKQTLEALFVAGSQRVGDNIDNITVSPRGGILLCENGDPVSDEYGPGTRLIGLTADGDSYAFAKNNVELKPGQVVAAKKRVPGRDYRGGEFAGACFDPAGEVLFVNLQRPGITFAIWGPWKKGNLG